MKEDRLLTHHAPTSPTPPAAEAAPPGELLRACPACEYDLEGLPVEHICPECGLRYDRRWEVFGFQQVYRKKGRKGTARAVVRVILAGMALHGTIMTAIMIRQYGLSLGFAFPIAYTLLLVATFVFLEQMRGRVLAISSTELLLIERRGVVKRWKLARMSKVRVHPFGAWMMFEYEGRTARLARKRFFVNPGDELPFVMRLNAAAMAAYADDIAATAGGRKGMPGAAPQK